MNVAELKAQYIEAALAHAVHKTESARKANADHKRLVEAFHALRAAGDAGWSVIRSLISDTRPEVRLWAAVHLLQIDPAAATPVLLDLSADEGLLGFEAGIVLQEWRAGRFQWA